MIARRAAAAFIAVVLLACVAAVPASARVSADRSVAAAAVADGTRWGWPVPKRAVLRDFEVPAHRYGPGHRGIDIDAAVGTAIAAPEAGRVAFSGRVVDRDVITIDHGDGLVSTLEPVNRALPAGTAVERGDVVGYLDGGHAPSGGLHLGVRRHGEYINPMLLLGELLRAVLLPCC